MPILNRNLASRNRVGCTTEAFELTVKRKVQRSSCEGAGWVPKVTTPFPRSAAVAALVLVGLAQLVGLMVVLLVTATPKDTPPTPTNWTNASLPLDSHPHFSLDRAYAHLQVITRAPHHFNMRANDEVRDFILDYAYRVRDQINRKVEVVDDRNTFTFTGHDTPTNLLGRSNVTGYMESGNVLVRIRGSAGTKNALLISAHFDSVQLSYGANDNGVGVAVAMEMLRLASVHPPKHDLIFNFNNHEEAGVLGSVAFMAHKWAPSVKAFLNLEGSGAGGRVLLFQCSNPKLVALARAIPRPTTSVLGNDLFQMRVINSVTDYAVYSNRRAIPGVDFAIYRNRAVYHTALDNFHHAFPATLSSMGESLWPLAQAIDRSDFLDADPTVQPAGIFYSLLSLVSFHYSFATDHAIGLAVMLLLLLTVILCGTLPKCRRGMSPDRWALAVGPAAKALLAIGVNLLAIHRHWVLLYVMNMLLAAACVAVADGLFRGDQPCHRRFQASAFALAGVWLLAMVGQRVAGIAQVGILYLMTWFVCAYVGTFALTLVVDLFAGWKGKPSNAQPRIREGLLGALQITVMGFVPCVLLHDAVNTVMGSMSQSLVTGTSPMLVYTLLSAFGLMALLPAIPIFSLAGDHLRVTLPFIGLAWLGLVVAALLVPPLSPQDPSTLFWGQTYDLATLSSPVTVRGLVGLGEAAPKLLEASARTPTLFKLIPGSPFATLTFEGLEPTFEVPPAELIKITHLPSNRTRRFQVKAHDTRKCRLAIPTAIQLTHLKGVGYQPIPTNRPPPRFGAANTNPSHLVYLLRRKFEAGPWTVSFHTNLPRNQKIQITVTCYYDEYLDHVPALAPLHLTPNKFLPETLTVSTNAHVLEVRKAVEV
ncbi:hypothetical protein L0F63_003289 [Massospora cicadina]|nr:hypothetical protein L0F63_003289 [Massospora cicadina]